MPSTLSGSKPWTSQNTNWLQVDNWVKLSEVDNI